MTVPQTASNVFLIWGGRGWIAGHLKRILEGQGKIVQTTTVRMEDREGVIKEMERIKPTRVLNCAGCTGRPNVDWCEDNKQETIRSNVIGMLDLADVCYLRGIHLTNFATGCRFPEHATIGRNSEADSIQVSTITMTLIPSAARLSRRRIPPISAALTTPLPSGESRSCWNRSQTC